MQLQRPLAVVTSTIDGDVLSLLAGAAGSFTTGQLHRLVPRRSVDGIRLALSRLADQGIVDAEQVGRAVRYSLNRAHLAAPAIMLLADQRAELLRRIGEDLSNWSDPPVYAAIFGSASRGDMRPDSDIDLFLVRPDRADDARWEEAVEHLAQRITRWTGNDAQPLVMSVDEVTRGAGSERVLHDIARDGLGVGVHGPSSWLRRQMKLGV